MKDKYRRVSFKWKEERRRREGDDFFRWLRWVDEWVDLWDLYR